MDDTLPLLQVFGAGQSVLPPRFDPYDPPEWFLRVIRCAVRGRVPVIDNDDLILDGPKYVFAGMWRDEVLYAWRRDSGDVWTLVSVYTGDPDDLESLNG